MRAFTTWSFSWYLSDKKATKEKKAVLFQCFHNISFRRNWSLSCLPSSGTLDGMLFSLSLFDMYPDWPIAIFYTRNKNLNLGINCADADSERARNWRLYQRNLLSCQLSNTHSFSAPICMFCRQRHNGMSTRHCLAKNIEPKSIHLPLCTYECMLAISALLIWHVCVFCH